MGANARSTRGSSAPHNLTARCSSSSSSSPGALQGEPPRGILAANAGSWTPDSLGASYLASGGLGDGARGIPGQGEAEDGGTELTSSSVCRAAVGGNRGISYGVGTLPTAAPQSLQEAFKARMMARETAAAADEEGRGTAAAAAAVAARPEVSLGAALRLAEGGVEWWDRKLGMPECLQAVGAVTVGAVAPPDMIASTAAAVAAPAGSFAVSDASTDISDLSVANSCAESRCPKRDMQTTHGPTCAAAVSITSADGCGLSALVGSDVGGRGGAGAEWHLLAEPDASPR